MSKCYYALWNYKKNKYAKKCTFSVFLLLYKRKSYTRDLCCNWGDGLRLLALSRYFVNLEELGNSFIFYKLSMFLPQKKINLFSTINIIKFTVFTALHYLGIGWQLNIFPDHMWISCPFLFWHPGYPSIIVR